jgi:hypothetical protein
MNKPSTQEPEADWDIQSLFPKPRVTSTLRIVECAIEQDGVIYRGGRHYTISRTMCLALKRDRPLKGQQGFIASNGKFYNREVSAGIAFAAGQIGRIKKELYSEDIWPDLTNETPQTT